MKKKLPYLSLQNEYTFLNKQNKKPNVLTSFLEQLIPQKKLPSIDKKYMKTARKVQKQLQAVQNLMQIYKKQRGPLSQHRYNIKPASIMPIYIPMPMTIPLNMQLSTFLPQVQQQPVPQNNASVVVQPTQTEPTLKQQKNITDKQQSSRKPKQINKFAEKSKINRFRVYAYVVYFSIYFKYFSRKFTQLRRNWFHDRYAINDGKIIFESSSKILKHLHQIDIYKMLQTAKQRVKDFDLEQKSNKTSDSVLTLIHFVTLLIQYARQYMTSQAFIRQHHEVFTVGVLTQNFMLSNLYLPQQAALLHIHPQGYIVVQQQTEIILLMLKIIIKILVYNFLLGLKYSRQWNSKQQKSHGLDDSDMDQLWMITRNSGIFLSIVCQQIYDKTYKQMANPTLPYNFNQQSLKFNILPAKTLQQVKRSKSINANSNPLDSNSKLIANLQGYTDIQTLISIHPSLKKFKDKIKLKIIDFLTVIYTQLKYQQAKVYDFIRVMTLDEKYLILKGRKQDLVNKKKKKKNKGSKDDKKNNNGRGSHRKGNKKGNKNSGDGQQDSDYSYDQNGNRDSSHRKNKNRQGNEDSDQDSQDSSNENGSSFHSKKRKKKLRFKVQQAFYDHKFEGHNKLQKLKRIMGKK